jgi:hypothetical protein
VQLIGDVLCCGSRNLSAPRLDGPNPVRVWLEDVATVDSAPYDFRFGGSHGGRVRQRVKVLGDHRQMSAGFREYTPIDHDRWVVVETAEPHEQNSSNTEDRDCSNDASADDRGGKDPSGEPSA